MPDTTKPPICPSEGFFLTRYEVTAMKKIPLAQGDISVIGGTPLQIGGIVRGSNLDMYANAQSLVQVKDNLRSKGSVGIAAGMGNVPLAPRFNFAIFSSGLPKVNRGYDPRRICPL